jgi:putative inorganic carbon (hco3(-)) transporter
MRAAAKPTDDGSPAGDFVGVPERGDPAQRLPFGLLTSMLAFFILRPWDLFPVLGAVRPMMLITSLTIAAFLLSRPVIEFWNVRPAKLLVVFLGVICFSVLFSYWKSQSFSIATDYLKQIALFILIVNLVKTHDRLRMFIAVFVAACTYHGVAAIIDFSAAGGARLTGIAEPYFGDPNDLALSLVMVLPLAWWLSSVVASRWIRLAIYCSMLAMIAGVIASQSRGGLLALIAAMAVLIGYQGREILGTLTMTLAAAVAFSVLVLPADVFERYRTITEYQKDESAVTRLAVWKAGVTMCADHPLTGIGAGAFESVYGQYYIDRKRAGNIWRAAHSSYVEIAAELGVFGLAVFLAILSSAVVLLIQSRQVLNRLARFHPVGSVDLVGPLRSLNAALLSSVGGFLVGAAFLSRGYDMIFMIILSLIAVVSRKTQSFADGISGADPVPPSQQKKYGG